MYSYNLHIYNHALLTKKGSRAFVVLESIYLHNCFMNKSLLQFTIFFSVTFMGSGYFSVLNISRFYKDITAKKCILLMVYFSK